MLRPRHDWPTSTCGRSSSWRPDLMMSMTQLNESRQAKSVAVVFCTGRILANCFRLNSTDKLNTICNLYGLRRSVVRLSFFAMHLPLFWCLRTVGWSQFEPVPAGFDQATLEFWKQSEWVPCSANYCIHNGIDWLSHRRVAPAAWDLDTTLVNKDSLELEMLRVVWKSGTGILKSVVHRKVRNPFFPQPEPD